MQTNVSKHHPSESPRFSSVESIHTRICEMECRHDLLQYEIDGWCVWPVLRFQVALALSPVSGVDCPRLSNARRAMIALRDIPSLMTLRRARYVAKTFSSGLLEEEGGRYKDIWFDDLLRDMGDYLKIETINNPTFNARRRTELLPSRLTTTLFDLTAAIMARVRAPRDVAEIAQQLSACLQSEFGSETFSLRWVAIRLLHHLWLKKLYGWLLRRVQPACLLVADPGEYALVAAAKERGIKVVELQHGINDRYHSGYSWTSYAIRYKSRMPLVDRLLLYGEYWKQELDGGSFWTEELRVVGSPRVDQYRQRKATREEGDLCTVVLTTQGMDVDRLIAFVAEFLEQAKEQVDLRLYIKLHPVLERDKSAYEAAFRDDPRVQVFLGNESPSTFELLTQARLHISISSATHYDALGLGVPTVILPFASHEVVLPLHEAGHAFIAHTSAELFDLVSQSRYENVSEEIREYYFKSGALAEMKRELV